MSKAARESDPLLLALEYWRQSLLELAIWHERYPGSINDVREVAKARAAGREWEPSDAR